MYSNSAESFGKQWQVGDVVGVFLDLIDHTISKNVVCNEIPPAEPAFYFILAEITDINAFYSSQLKKKPSHVSIISHNT